MIQTFEKKHTEQTIQTYIKSFSDEPWNEVWQPDWIANRLDWLQSIPTFRGFVAIENQQVVGAILGYSKPYKDRNDFEVLEMFVDPDHQGQGIGKALMETLSGYVEQNAVIHVLTARGTGPEAFYEQSGFKRNDHLSFLSKRNVV